MWITIYLDVDAVKGGHGNEAGRLLDLDGLFVSQVIMSHNLVITREDHVPIACVFSSTAADKKVMLTLWKVNDDAKISTTCADAVN